MKRILFTFVTAIYLTAQTSGLITHNVVAYVACIHAPPSPMMVFKITQLIVVINEVFTPLYITMSNMLVYQ